jgi:signal transduction histidine kinase
MRAQIGMLFLKRDQRVVLQSCVGMPLFDASYDLGEDLTGRAALGDAEIITSLQKDDKYDDEIGKFLADREDGRPGVVESGMVVPIFAKDTPIGVMKVVNKIGSEERYGPDDLEIFKTYADNMSVAIENATDYELTNKQLVIHERNAALSTLVTAVAHEIRNTSGLIPANVAGLRAQLGTFNEQVARRLNLIERVASQATDFANELAGFAASHRGELVVRDVNDVVFAATTELQELPKFKNTDTVRLERRLSEAPLMCRIFENPFIQIVRNIVINAFQALEKSSDGQIVVTSAAVCHDGEEAMAVLRFEDNGPGIPSDYRERIFQADFTTKPNGTGVGLWLAKNQLGQIGGTISVEGNEGGGARFVVTLPLAKEGGGQPNEATLASPAR